jgi:hypothetical protein
MKSLNRRFSGIEILLLALLTWAGPASSATFQMDDSRSVVLNSSVPMRWRTLSPAKGDHVVQGLTQVQVKLDTRPWAGKFGKIFMALPAQPGSQIQVHWQAQGLFLGGQLASGQRGLVWSGTMPTALLEDLITVTIETDGRLLSSAQLLRFNFEIDIP